MAYPVGFGAYPVGFGAYPVGFGAYPVGLGAYPVGLGAYPVGFEGKIFHRRADIFNGGVKNPIEKIRRGYCVKGQWWH